MTSYIEFGHFTLLLALLSAAWGSILPAIGIWKQNGNLMALAKAGAKMNFLLLTIAFGILIYAFVTSDFSVALVVGNSHSLKPLLYKIAGVWGNHEGSLLLWTLILSIYGFALSKTRMQDLTLIALTVQNGLILLFLSLSVFTSNPFARVFPPPVNGNDLNPLLQDPALAFHPPILYTGYVGYSLVFALAIAGLLKGRIDKDWAKIVRPWAMIAWISLTAGLSLGSWWAYYELGWGGWWFWDPVENAALLPWLTGTALMHSIIVLEKRGHLPNWTVLLALLCFALSLLGTFLVRSGVITSVHSFASDPMRGMFILGILGITLGGSLLLYALKRPATADDQTQLVLFSREGALVINNLLLFSGMITVLIGTLYPLILDSLTGTLISVGPPYFALTFVPLMLPMLALMAIGPYIAWGQYNIAALWNRIERFSLLTAFITVTILWWRDDLSLWSMLCFAAGLWVIISALAYWVERAQGKLTQLFPQPASVFAIILGHLGLGIVILGMVGSSFWAQTSSAALSAGQKTELHGYEFTFKGIENLNGPNYNIDRAAIIMQKDLTVVTLHPEKRWYPIAGKDTTEVAIQPVGAGDMYVALGTEQAEQPGKWLIRFYYHPLVNLLWGGVVVIILGGFFGLYAQLRSSKNGQKS